LSKLLRQSNFQRFQAELELNLPMSSQREVQVKDVHFSRLDRSIKYEIVNFGRASSVKQLIFMKSATELVSNHNWQGISLIDIHKPEM